MSDAPAVARPLRSQSRNCRRLDGTRQGHGVVATSSDALIDLEEMRAAGGSLFATYRSRSASSAQGLYGVLGLLP